MPTPLVSDRPVVYQLDVLPGLERAAAAEVRVLTGGAPVAAVGEGRLRVRGVDAPARLERARTVVAVYRVVHLAVPRPRALLGHEHLSQLGRVVRSVAGERRFSGLRVVAAGAETTVMVRLGEALAAELGVPRDQHDGDLVLRIVRDAARTGWEVQVRTTPRPLSARPWRVSRFPGSLNATIAAHMVRLARPRPADRAVNLMCGAGTIAVEHLLAAPQAVVVGADIDRRRALPAAVENARAAGVGGRLALVQADVGCAPFAGRAFSVLYCDLPYGDKVRPASGRDDLYAALLDEAARLALPAARFVAITEDIARFDRLLRARSDAWRVRERLRVFQGGHRPEVFSLESTGGSA